MLKQAGGNLDEIQKALAKSTGKSQQEIAKIFKDSGIQAAKADAEAAAVTFSGLSPRMMAIITDAYERTVGEISNITRTTAGATNQAFIDICDDAYWKVRTGAQSYTAAMLEGVKALGQYTSWRCVAWKSATGTSLSARGCLRTPSLGLRALAL